jgi:hypothetical protein
MFGILRSLIDLIAGVIGGVLRLVMTFVGSCFGLVLVMVILAGVVVVLVLHLL